MTLTTAQLQMLKADIAAQTDPTFVAYRTAGNENGMADWYAVDSGFVIFKPTESTFSIGDVINYIAVAAMTVANLDRLNTFYRLNPNTFEPIRSDQRTFLADTFSGALGGFGQATRDALDVLYRRNLNRGEKVYATGAGTTATPGTASWEGVITAQNISDALRS